MTNSSNTASFPAGYYDAFTVTTNITSLPGTVSYTYHHHSLSNADYTTASASGGSYADSYQSSTKGGCFQSAVYKAHTHKTTCYSSATCTHNGGQNYTVVDINYPTHGIDNDHTVTIQCPNCGQVASGGGQSVDKARERAVQNLGASPKSYSTLSCGKTAGTRYSTEGVEYYTRSCGKVDGQITSATIVY